jgi:hypothetical protein
LDSSLVLSADISRSKPGDTLAYSFPHRHESLIGRAERTSEHPEFRPYTFTIPPFDNFLTPNHSSEASNDPPN